VDVLVLEKMLYDRWRPHLSPRKSVWKGSRELQMPKTTHCQTGRDGAIDKEWMKWHPCSPDLIPNNLTT
jgi:hypothetical protein